MEPSDDTAAQVDAFWTRRLAQVSAAAPLPATIRSMAITPELREDYRGHEVLLHQRAKHSPQCYPRFDDWRLCLIRRLKDPNACKLIVRAYRPCAEELKRERDAAAAVKADAAAAAADEERRRLLNAKARELSAAQRERDLPKSAPAL
jgi:hypothetical protein